MRTTRSARLAFLTWWRYGSTRPEAVQPDGAPSVIYVDPCDRRALKKIVHASIRKRVSVPMRFWRSMVDAVQPDLALDVGANYGECFAGTWYPAGSRVIAVEANPGLVPYLRRTCAAHPQSGQLRVVNCLAGAAAGSPQALYFDPQWTGRGSALAPAAGTNLQRVLVPVDTLDSIVEREFGVVTGKKLVMKVDVEGYEGTVLRGFGRLESFAQVAGILEFDTAWLDKAGTPPREVFDRLLALGPVFDTLRHQSQLFPIASWAELSARHGGGDFHTDLIFHSRDLKLPSTWQVSA